MQVLHLLAVLALPIFGGEVPGTSAEIAADSTDNSTAVSDFAIPAPPRPLSQVDTNGGAPRLPGAVKPTTYSNDWSSIVWFVLWWGCILVASLWWLSRKKAWLTREKQRRLEELVYGGAGAVARFVNQRLPKAVRRSSSGVIDHLQMTRLSEMPFDDVAASRHWDNSVPTNIVGRRTTPEGSAGSRGSTPPHPE